MNKQSGDTHTGQKETYNQKKTNIETAIHLG